MGYKGKSVGSMPLLYDKNPHPLDGLILFQESGHRYYYTPTGEKIRKSMTSVIKPYFETFDGMAVARKCVPKWLNDETSRYGALCNYLRMVTGLDNEAIAAEIAKLWDANGRQAAAEGTKMHQDLELYIQDLLPPPSKDMEPPHAVGAYLGWLDSFYPDQQLQPWRVEFPIVLVEEGTVVCCGTVDYIMRSKKTGKYWVLDWKHTNPKRGLLGKRKPGASKPFFPPDMAKGLFQEFEASDYNKYSAQLLGYRFMLEHGGYLTRDQIAGCFIVQIHEDLDRAHVVEVNDDDEFKEAVDAMMEKEIEEAKREAAEAKREAAAPE